ncbi:peptidoglycan D,D-transpeptidase FtsI family protein [Marisediminicola senii]|uniref:peptidoglycan D,D-transpeptidase FtsI family protein n=1 Tax=Marisediminicola senii TaxID=2711233 RepID=UPI0013EDEB70|nr:penicillin-binding protein 2 [Marisediminicola senii]
MVTVPRTTRRRLSLAMLITIAVFSVFIVRLVDIQIVRADELNASSLDQRAISDTTYAARGDIVDSSGDVLAGSVIRYDITTSPRIVPSSFERGDGDDAVEVTLAEASAEVAEITGQTQADVLRSFTANPESDFEYVVQKVTTEQMRAVTALEIPGVYPVERPARIYPDGSVAGNLIGFVGTEGPQNGLEFTEDSCLASTNGSSTYERGADGIRLPGSTVTTQPAIEGGTVTTTIDADLQWSVQQMIAEQAVAIGAESATASVTEVKTGKVLALADYPSVDPNNVDGTPATNLGSLAFSTPYEPGSTFKPMTAAMLLDSGVSSPASRVTVPYRWTSPEGSTVRDAVGHDELRLTLAGVIQESSNVGISQLAVGLSNQARYDYMRAFGVGSRTEVDFQGESAGLLAETWDDQQKYDVSYGQGVAVTAAQMASIYQTLGNGGERLPLTLVTGCTLPDGTVVDAAPTGGTQVVSEAAADGVVEMMEGVVTGGDLAADLAIPGYRVAAKSGTAEIAENGRYTSERIVSIAGLAPAEDPQYAVVVTFTKPSTIKTSAAAAPTFNKIMTQVLKTYRVTPSPTPSPKLPTTW